MTLYREPAPKRALPMLDRLKIASPCEASWADMVGSDTVRHCQLCDKSVYNVSAMTRYEAETFLEEHEVARLCLRMYRRDDGTVMVADCPIGAARKWEKRRRLTTRAIGVSVVLFFFTLGLNYMDASTGSVSDTGAQKVYAPIGAQPTPTSEPQSVYK